MTAERELRNERERERERERETLFVIGVIKGGRGACLSLSNLREEQK